MLQKHNKIYSIKILSLLTLISILIPPKLALAKTICSMTFNSANEKHRHAFNKYNLGTYSEIYTLSECYLNKSDITTTSNN